MTDTEILLQLWADTLADVQPNLPTDADYVPLFDIGF